MTGTHSSPLLHRAVPVGDYRSLARTLATNSTEPGVLRALLKVNEPATLQEVVRDLDARDDLPIDVMAVLVAHHPYLRASPARLRSALFPDTDGCHRFTRTVATLEHQPDALDHSFVVTPRFAQHAVEADTTVLLKILTETLSGDQITPDRLSTVQALLAARRHTTTPDEFSRRVGPQVDCTLGAILRRPLTAVTAQLRAKLETATGGLTRTVDLFLTDLTAAVHGPADLTTALAVVRQLAQDLGGDPIRLDLDREYSAANPLVAYRWSQVATLIRRAPGGTVISQLWSSAWQDSATTSDGSSYEPHQRILVTAYRLLTEHARQHATGTPTTCWAIDPDGRQLVQAVADRFTGYQGIRPLDHLRDDTLLLAFARGLAKQHRDRTASELQIVGFMAAVKAARSKSYVLDASQPTQTGVVVPMRAETARLRPPTPDNPQGQNAVAVKIAQLTWLLDTTPGSRADVLFVDEDRVAESAALVEQILRDIPPVPAVAAAASRRPADPAPGSIEQNTVKGGAVIWGLQRMLGTRDHRTLIYTDVDVTYPLDQLGLLLAALVASETPGAAIGSRRTPDAYGYYPPGGPNATARLYQQAVTELLDLDNVTDPQAGFKAFSADLLREILPATRDRQLTFDTELLLLTRLAGGPLTEVGVCTLHRYVEGATHTPRDYDSMLARVHQQARAHGVRPGHRPTPVLDRIAEAGSLAAAARRLGVIRLSPAPEPPDPAG